MESNAAFMLQFEHLVVKKLLVFKSALLSIFDQGEDFLLKYFEESVTV